MLGKAQRAGISLCLERNQPQCEKKCLRFVSVTVLGQNVTVLGQNVTVVGRNVTVVGRNVTVVGRNVTVNLNETDFE